MGAKLTQEKYEKKLNEKRNTVVCVDKYVNINTPITHKCLICGGKWESPPSAMLNSIKNCPFCLNKRVLVGFNDMWTTAPNIAFLLLNPEDGYKYTKSSSKKVDWKCPECGNIIRNKSIDRVYQYQKLTCNICNDGISYPEKFFTQVLIQLGCDFETQKSFNWIKGKRYDFYIETLNCIIETHGDLHYNNKYSTLSKKSSREEQLNDVYKYEAAIRNGIKNYIVIDSRVSSIDWIKNSILKSKLNELYNLSCIDWNCCHENSLRSKTIEACKLWNNGYKTNEIATLLKIHRQTASRYLTRCALVGLCDYDSSKEIIKIKNQTDCRVKICCKTTGMVFDSITDAAIYYKTNRSNIGACCSGFRKHAGKLPNGTLLEWEFYDKKYTPKKAVSRVPVNQYDKSKNYIATFNSLREAERTTGVQRKCILGCCNGLYKNAGGYVWQYANR